MDLLQLDSTDLTDKKIDDNYDRIFYINRIMTTMQISYSKIQIHKIN